jgi:hypothetical protein
MNGIEQCVDEKMECSCSRRLKGTLKFALEKCPPYARFPHSRIPCSTLQQLQASRRNNIQIKELNSFVKS